LARRRCPLHQIQAWLGHANISQTSIYLAVRDDGGDVAMARFETLRAEAERKAKERNGGKSCKRLANPKAKGGRGEWI
jgi:integrase